MTRLIDADALVSALNNGRLKEQTGRAVPFNAGVAFALTMVEYAQTIDQVRHGRWIPCEERLPELDETCLVTEKDGSIRHCYFDSADPVLFATVEEGMYVRNVVAWMPLPAPYKEETDE